MAFRTLHKEWMERIVSKYYRSSRPQQPSIESAGSSCALLVAETKRDRSGLDHLPGTPPVRRVRIEGRLEVSF